eukprot:c12720_g2_i1 orf=315-788(+)
MSSGGGAGGAGANPQLPSRTYQFDKLNGTNYLVWRVRMQMIFQRANLWTIVDGTEADPEVANVNAHDAWVQRDLTVGMDLILHLGDRQVQMVRSLTTSAEIWALLRVTYERTDIVSKVTLLKRLINFTMGETPCLNHCHGWKIASSITQTIWTSWAS